MTTSPLPASVEEYLSWLAVERGRATATLSAYRRDIAAFVEYLASRHRTVEAATTRDLEAFLARAQHVELAPATVARLSSSLRGLYGFFLEEGITASDPTALLAARRAGSSLPVVLSESQVAALLADPASDEPVDVRDRAILELLYGTGMRVSELVGLSLGDVDFDEELVRVTGKGDKQRLVPLGRGAAVALHAWLDAPRRTLLDLAADARDAHTVFCNLRGRRLTRQGVDLIIRRHARRVGLPASTSAHTLRHTCATHMLARGADVRVIQELLGHASVATTQRYTKVSPTHLIEAYRGAHPRAGDAASAT